MSNNADILDVTDDHSQISKEHEKISLSSVHSSIDVTTLGRDNVKDNHLLRNETKIETLLGSLQFLQDLLIASQKKFKQYDGISEYNNYDNIEIFEGQTLAMLSESEMETHISKLRDSFARMLKNIYDNMTSMDTAVTRLRNNNDKLVDELKLQNLPEKKESSYSKERRWGTLDNRSQDLEVTNIIDNLKLDKNDLLKKVNKMKSRIDDFKTEIEDYKSEIKTLERQKNTLHNDFKKLKKENKELEKEIDSYDKNEVKELKKQIKKLQKEIDHKDDIISDQKNRLENNSSKDLERKIDMLMTSSADTESKKLKKYEETFEKLKTLNEEIKHLKELNYNNSAKEEEIISLKKQIEGLDNELQRIQSSKRDEVISLNDQLTRFNDHVSQKEITIENLKADIKRLTESHISNILEKDHEINLQNEEVVRLNDLIYDLNNKIKSSEVKYENLRKVIEELKQTIQTNDHQFRMASEKENQKLTAFRDQIDVLQRTLHTKEKDQQCREQGLLDQIEELQESKNRQIEWMNRELDTVICKCHTINMSHQSVGPPSHDSFEMNSQNDDLMRARQQLLRMSVEDEHIFDSEPMNVYSVNDGNESLPNNSLMEKIREQDAIIKRKDVGLENMVKKIKPLMENELQFKAEKDILEQRIQDLELQIMHLKEDNNNKQRALIKMRDKMKSMNSSENVDVIKRDLEGAKDENLTLENEIKSVSEKLRASREECELLKKNKLCLESEIDNLKMINFKKKTGDSL